MPPFYYSLGTFGVLEFLGDIYPGFINNAYCYPLLGCNAGFFGYDAAVHWVSGTVIGLGLLWLNRRSAWKFALASLAVALGWEFLEWSYDTIRRVAFHMDLLHPANILTQPTPIDTLGDMAMGLLGTAVIYGLFWLRRRRAALAAPDA
jgi:hypothetical protein